MAWTTHPTVSFEQLWAFSDQNTYITDNLQFIEDSPCYILPINEGQVAGSGLTGAPVELAQSSSVDTIKPQYYQMLFDADADEGRIWQNLVAPRDYNGNGLTLHGNYTCGSTDSSGSVVLVAQISAASDGDASFSAKSFDTANSLTHAAPDEADVVDAFSITMTNEDSLTAGDVFQLVLYRDADNGSDDRAGDFKLLSLWLTYDYA